MKLGQAAGRVLKRHNPTGRASVLIGKDTRVSGYMLEAALQAGFSSAGVDVVPLRSHSDTRSRVSHPTRAAAGCRRCYLCFA